MVPIGVRFGLLPKFMMLPLEPFGLPITLLNGGVTIVPPIAELDDVVAGQQAFGAFGDAADGMVMISDLSAVVVGVEALVGVVVALVLAFAFAALSLPMLLADPLAPALLKTLLPPCARFGVDVG